MAHLPETELNGEYVTTLAAYSLGEVAYGQCADLSEAVQNWWRIEGDPDVDDIVVVQGLTEKAGTLNCHYALGVTMNGAPPVVVDFTYAQVDDGAEWPVVMTPEEWQDRLLEEIEYADIW